MIRPPFLFFSDYLASRIFVGNRENIENCAYNDGVCYINDFFNSFCVLQRLLNFIRILIPVLADSHFAQDTISIHACGVVFRHPDTKAEFFVLESSAAKGAMQVMKADR